MTAPNTIRFICAPRLCADEHKLSARDAKADGGKHASRPRQQRRATPGKAATPQPRQHRQRPESTGQSWPEITHGLRQLDHARPLGPSDIRGKIAQRPASRRLPGILLVRNDPDDDGSFPVRGPAVEADAPFVGVGADFSFSEAVTATVSYDGVFGDTSDSHGLVAQLNFRF